MRNVGGWSYLQGTGRAGNRFDSIPIRSWMHPLHPSNSGLRHRSAPAPVSHAMPVAAFRNDADHVEVQYTVHYGQTKWQSVDSPMPFLAQPAQLNLPRDQAQPSSFTSSTSADQLLDQGIELQKFRDAPPARVQPDLPDYVQKVLFVFGLAARGDTEFFQQVIDHLVSLLDGEGQPLVAVCTFDNRGIGESTAPVQPARYSTKIMARDCIALLDHLGWLKAHLIGMSMGGMIASKVASLASQRVASLTLMGCTARGWHIAATLAMHPMIAILSGLGTRKNRIRNNLKVNFAPHYLRHREPDGRTRLQVMADNTLESMSDPQEEAARVRQPPHGRSGQMRAVLTHWLSASEMRAIRSAGFPVQVVTGRHDKLAGVGFAAWMAKKLRCPLLAMEAGHAGIAIESISELTAALERIVLGALPSHAARRDALQREATRRALAKTLSYELATAFAPGKVQVGAAG